MAEKTEFTPWGDRILVRPLPDADDVIKVPDGAKPRPLKGEIIACGPGHLTENGFMVRSPAHPGHIVLYGKYAGNEIVIDGETLLVMREEEVLGNITNETT